MIGRLAMRCGLPVLSIACGQGVPGTDQPAASGAAESGAAAPADSLVATAPGGAEIWLTLAREGKAADGTTCIDRAIEIRREGARVPVPLLYTGTAPEIVNESTMRARLSDRCAPGDTYLVDLRTGRPVRER